MDEVRVPFDDLRHDEDGRMLLEGELFTGVAFDHWPDGSLATESQYRDGIEDGPVKLWHPNGRLGSETFFVRGRARGIKREWHENGVLKREVIIGDKGVRKEEREWDEKGTLLFEFHAPP